MPLYEYQCDKCGNVFEVMQKFADAPLEVHADCGGKVVRLISAPGLHFKGSGWYITDYARSGSVESKSKGSDKADSKSDSKTETKSGESKSTESKSGGETKSESKPASTASKSE